MLSKDDRQPRHSGSYVILDKSIAGKCAVDSSSLSVCPSGFDCDITASTSSDCRLSESTMRVSTSGCDCSTAEHRTLSVALSFRYRELLCHCSRSANSYHTRTAIHLEQCNTQHSSQLKSKLFYDKLIRLI